MKCSTSDELLVTVAGESVDLEVDGDPAPVITDGGNGEVAELTFGDGVVAHGHGSDAVHHRGAGTLFADLRISAANGRAPVDSAIVERPVGES